jgi:hypothetical protein
MLIALPAMAQPNLDQDRPSPPLTLEDSIAVTALWAAGPYLVSQRCGIGDPAKWQQILSAMDRRIRHCAERHFEWQAIRQDALAHARRDGVLSGSDDGLAEGRFREAVAKAGPEMDKEDPAAMCAWYRASTPWRDLLAPGSVPAEEAAAAWREEAKRDCPHGLCAESFRNLRQWGEQQSWVTAPCATLFPEK